MHVQVYNTETPSVVDVGTLNLNPKRNHQHLHALFHGDSVNRKTNPASRLCTYSCRFRREKNGTPDTYLQHTVMRSTQAPKKPALTPKHQHSVSNTLPNSATINMFSHTESKTNTSDVPTRLLYAPQTLYACVSAQPIREPRHSSSLAHTQPNAQAHPHPSSQRPRKDSVCLPASQSDPPTREP